MIEFLLVAAGGFTGAIVRYFISKKINPKEIGRFPLATFLVNIVGAFLLGYLFGVSKNVDLLLGVGFLGALTTFSTFNLELAKMFQKKHFAMGLFYMLSSYTIGLLLAMYGISLAPKY